MEIKKVGLKLADMPFFASLMAVTLLAAAVILVAGAQTGAGSFVGGPTPSQYVGMDGNPWVRVSWSTGDNTTARLCYGSTAEEAKSCGSYRTDYDIEFDGPPLDTYHAVDFGPVEYSTTYYFVAEATTEGGAKSSSSVGSFKVGDKPSPVVCGDGKCETGEDATSCKEDCYKPTCGDKVCETGETAASCAADCYKPTCGDGKCETGEDATSCKEDCYKAACGNGTKDTGEDCDSGSKNGVACTAAYGSSCSYCSTTCKSTTVKGAYCGDGKCSDGEVSKTCSADCKPTTEEPSEDTKTEEKEVMTNTTTEETEEQEGQSEEEMKALEEAIQQKTEEESGGEESKEQGTESGEGKEGEGSGGENIITADIQDALSEMLTGMYGGTTTGSTGEGGGAGGAADEEEDLATKTCKENGISLNRCNIWLEARYADKSCAAAGYLTQESCEKYLTDSNGGTFPGCEGKTAEECAKIKALTTIGYLPNEQKEKADDIIDKLKEDGKVAALEGLTAISDEIEGKAAWWKSAAGEGEETSKELIVIDADQDGLTDDMEGIIGTDPNNSDTDGDGESDGDEVKNGTDPLKKGKDKFEKKLDDTAKALATGQALQQPLGAGEVDSGFTVQSTFSAQNKGTFAVSGKSTASPGGDGTEDGDGTDGGEGELKGGILLSGTGRPGETHLLFIYSYVPLVLATTADENGNWTYDLGSSISDGEHQVYVAVTDETGQITKKSSPLSLFVREAQAVAPSDFLRADVNVAEEPVAELQRWYILATVALIVVAALVSLFVISQIRKSPRVQV